MKQHHTIKKSILNIRHVLLKAMKFVMILNVVQGFFLSYTTHLFNSIKSIYTWKQISNILKCASLISLMHCWVNQVFSNTCFLHYHPLDWSTIILETETFLSDKKLKLHVHVYIYNKYYALLYQTYDFKLCYEILFFQL